MLFVIDSVIKSNIEMYLINIVRTLAFLTRHHNSTS